jgi:hypothetical protein
MSTHSIPVLWSMWQKGELSAEQRVPPGRGYILQNLLAFFQRQSELEKRVRLLEQTTGRPQV